ncbi:MAG: hypothetical protein KGH72_05215 [Candidatus Micrarchaeota archaeon]|nr:hypothetical protein [Candidatus Micrarchaeota archaeon]
MSSEMNVVRQPLVYKNMKDPSILKYYYKFQTISQIEGNEVYGASPPDIFVGRYGYPHVYVGPMVPPTFGDTSILATPERWVGKDIAQIVQMRSTLVRGMYRTKVTNADNGRIEEMLKELAIADNYGGVHEMLSSRPNLRMSFDDNSQPYGPSARLKDMRIEDLKVNKKLENAYEDTAMTAKDAIVELYSKGILVSKIQKSLSAGILGTGKRRKFVPTRWSITAVDDTLSKFRLRSVKEYEALDHVRIYQTIALDNRWLIIMLPGEWQYELVEAWYPNTTWNMDSKDIQIFSSYEPFKGRTKYAEIGGCYYAARLASSELLDRIKLQARVVILREAHPGYILPVGVWNVREHVRAALRGEPVMLENLDQALAFIAKRMDIPVNIWVRNSTLLRKAVYQKTLFN